MRFIPLILPITVFMSSCNPNETEKNSNPADESEVEITSDSITSEIPEQSDSMLVSVEVPVDNFRCFVFDPDTEGPTNMRNTPGGEIITTLPSGEDFMLHIIGQKDGWFKINQVDPFESDSFEIPGGIGWVHHSVLAISSRNYGNQKIELYQNADANSKVVASFTDEKLLRFTAISGNFVHITYEENGKQYSGWMDLEWVCGNPVTNCS